MEYREGETLAARLRKGPLPFPETLRMGAQIDGALDAAHRQNLVHRDPKPGNIMLTRSGIKLVVFGLSKSEALPQTAMGGSEPVATQTLLPTRAALTRVGTLLGTLEYMSPEQLEGRESDARSDIFALGGMLYEMASG